MALIYAVEDDKNILEIEMFALKNSGYQVEGFECARDFYKKLEEKQPDLVLLDIMLPDEDGLEIVAKLRRRPETKKLPVIMVTAKSTEIDKVTTCTAEVTYNGELTSPVTLDTSLRFYTRSGREVEFEYTTLETDSVEVTLQVYKLATLPVEVSFINAPRDFDPSVLVYSLSKKTLNVAGPESQIDRLSTLSVGTIDLSTFALDKVYEMPIELPSGIRLLDNISSITVSFDSSRLETKTMNLPASCVQVINLPSTYTLTVETERLMNVTLCGPAGSLEALNPEQVVIEIDAEDFAVATGQQNIACRLYVPSNGKIFALGSYVLQCRIESN